MKKLFLVDGNSLASRAFYAMPYLTNIKGQPSGAVYGFANLLIKLLESEKPDEIVVAFDHARKTFRNEIFKDYKGTRKQTPPELVSQFPIIKEMLKIMEIETVEKEGIEADDIIGSLAKSNKEMKKIIISGDRDLLQLIDENTEVWLTKKGVTDLLKVGKENIYSEFGVYPLGVIELKALMGDSSDNIPGVPGIGEKTALKLVDDFFNIENLYKSLDCVKGKLREKLEQGKDLAFMSKDLATIRTDFSIKMEHKLPVFPFKKEVFSFFQEWNFGSLLKRPNLFCEGTVLERENKSFKKIKIEKIDDLNELKSKIKDKLAYNLEKMEFSANEEELYYLEPIITMFTDTLSLEEVIDQLKEVFESKKILKITENAKKDMKILKSRGIKLENFYDLGIADYLIFAGIKAKSAEVSASDYFDKMNIGKKKIEDDGLLKVLNEIELPLVEVLFEMEEEGFKIDEKRLLELDKDYSSQLLQLEKDIHSLAGEVFNINSPKQVSSVLFEKLKLKTYNNKKLSTGNEILLEIIDEHPIVEKIVKYRKLSKLQNTYIEVYKKICENKGNVIHTVFNQTLTSTGRLSSTDPNLQNIPARDDLGKEIRKLFISKFEKGSLISADYNQIELRLLADMSGEESLISAYEKGQDIHALTASEVFKIPLGKVSDVQRREAKAINFGIIYGISDFGLAQNIKTSRKNAKEYIDAYFEKYKKVKSFTEDNVAFAKQNGYIKTKFGRIRHIPEISASNFAVRSFAERVAMNMPLQGTASDIIKMAMIEVFEKLKRLKSKLVLQIHDELIVDVFPGEEKEVKEILKSSMEGIAKLKVKLPVSIGEGKNLYECK